MKKAKERLSGPERYPWPALLPFFVFTGYHWESFFQFPILLAESITAKCFRYKNMNFLTGKSLTQRKDWHRN
ncbi:MAG: hypothetical protein P8045_11210 [Candidatus Thiodiazotropha sp.]